MFQITERFAKSLEGAVSSYTAGMLIPMYLHKAKKN